MAPLAVFDSHLHIIDPRFPPVADQGYVPEPFTVEDYRAATAWIEVVGGEGVRDVPLVRDEREARIDDVQVRVEDG